MEHKQFFIEELKAGEDAMTVEGYGSIFNNEDQGGDIVMPGAFAKSIQSRGVSMLWQHKTDMPIGVWDQIEERQKGLFVKGRFIDTTLGLDAYKLTKAGAVKGLSIGYGVKRYEIDQAKGVRKLMELDLFEVSPVTFPMNEKATITRVKSLAGINVSDLTGHKQDIEAALRDAGASKSVAAYVTALLPTSALRDAGEVDEEKQLDELLSIFNKIKL